MRATRWTRAIRPGVSLALAGLGLLLTACGPVEIGLEPAAPLTATPTRLAAVTLQPRPVGTRTPTLTPSPQPTTETPTSPPSPTASATATRRPATRAPALTATDTPSPTSTPTATVTPGPSPTPTPCAHTWFFSETPAPAQCPAAAAATSPGASQRFERGRMLWVQSIDAYYILSGATSGDYRFTVGLVLKPNGSPDNRVGTPPPPGLVEPVSGFGLLWRGEVVGVDGVREQLGWALEAEAPFSTPYQCTAAPETAVCYVRDPDGRLTELGPGVWRQW